MPAVAEHRYARFLVVLAVVALVAGISAPTAAQSHGADGHAADAQGEPAADRGSPGDRPGPRSVPEGTADDQRNLPPAAVDRMKVPRAGAAAWQADDVTPGRVLVTTVDEASADRLVRDRRARRLAARVVALDVPAGQEYETAREMAADAGVVAAEADHQHMWFTEEEWPNDRLYPEQWSHQLTNVEPAWKITTGSRDVKVAVLDSGVDAPHPDLVDNVVAQVDVSNTETGPVERPVPSNNATCQNSLGAQHGTLVAGVLGAVGDNHRGVAGVAWQVGMVDVSLVSPEGGGCSGPRDQQVIAGLNYVATAHPDAVAVNLSLGRAAAICPASMQAAIDAVLANGTAVVAASGNEGEYFRMQPAGCDGVIAVGAAGSDGTRAAYSGKNRYLDLVGPGGYAPPGGCRDDNCVLTTAPGGDYAVTQGTSFAAPYVAGVIALMHAVRGGLRPWEVESLLEQTAVHPHGAVVHDEQYGWGLLDAGAAVRMAADGEPIAPPRPHPLTRWALPGSATEPVTQAATVSHRLFANQRAQHVVIARADDFADALAGSSLTYGIGPLLFARRSGGLPAVTRAELVRVLAPGRTVYLLGGDAALDTGLEAELRELGYVPRRLAGATREATAVEVARELEWILGDGLWPEVLLATRGNWPDAVAAGSFGAFFGAPVLLTQVAQLHPATERYLRETAAGDHPTFRGILGIGGGGVITDRSIVDAKAAARASYGIRIGGATRDATAVSVAALFTETLADAMDGDLSPTFAIAVNLDRSDAFSHTLSAAPLAGASASPFVPVRQVGDEGRVWVTDPAARWACGRDYDLLLPGGIDLLPQPVAEELHQLLEGTSPRC